MGLMYTSIRVKNMKKSVQFYRYLGLRVVGRRSPVPGEQIVSLEDRATRQKINLMWYGKTNRMYTPWKENGVELDHLMFEVKDAKKAYNALVRRGAPVAMKLWEHPEGRISMGFVKDPNGIWVGVRSMGRRRK